MKRKYIRYVCDRLLRPKRYVHEINSALVEDGALHMQVCLARWGMEYRTQITPKVVMKLLDKLKEKERQRLELGMRWEKAEKRIEELKARVEIMEDDLRHA